MLRPETACRHCCWSSRASPSSSLGRTEQKIWSKDQILEADLLVSHSGGSALSQRVFVTRVALEIYLTVEKGTWLLELRKEMQPGMMPTMPTDDRKKRVQVLSFIHSTVHGCFLLFAFHCFILANPSSCFLSELTINVSQQ